ncbi:MAG: MlaD family protein [Desulfobaccales bacterium]
MAKQANRIMIGVFVVVALILMAASLVLFSSGKFFQKTDKFVLYFDESLKGLSVGAPVLFKGIQVGSATSIVIVVDTAKHQADIPVIIEIDLDRFELREAGQTVEPQKNMPMLIKEGLRGMVTMQSLITGKLSIELGFYPDTPVNLKNINKRYTEIPTLPSTTSKLAQALDKLDLEAVQKKLESALEGIAKVANNPDLAASIMHLKETLRDARKLVNRVDRQVDPLADGVKKTAKDFGKLARDLDARVGELAPSLEKTLSAMRGVISDDAPLIVELENTLQEISAMSRSFRQMADYLEQHPEALIRGKGKAGGK